MKTIAVMTMAFLPATFFAALFAIPSLDWKSDTVVQSNHWIYWAFTVPATGLVFLIWLLLHYRNWLVGQYEKRSGKAQEREADVEKEAVSGYNRHYGSNDTRRRTVIG